MTITSWRATRRTRAADEAEVDALIWAWRQACEGAGLFQQVDTATGPTLRVPRLVDITLGPPTVFIVELLASQIAADVRRVAFRMAGHLGAVALQIEPRGLRHVRVELLTVDPLAALLPLELPRLEPGVLLGRGEDGIYVVEDFERGAHTIVQGVTRSGKSVFTYGVLAQLAGNPRAIVAGCDPTGLLWRPFAGSRHEEWQVSGVADPLAHEVLLERLVAEMDERITELPADRDTIEINDKHPMILVVLEELAGLLRCVDGLKTPKDDPGKRLRALIARLLAESAKVGIRVLILVQRAEAAVIGAFERAMCSLRISFRTDNRASVDLLHPGTPADLADSHTTAQPGIALMSAPGHELARIRAPFLGGYAEYASAVATACLPDVQS
ncbi:hypothetical protein [Pseudonocardia sp. GCM10023141]|uniref:hypothetical protein n=1 Tax=Pseudonocardia sp. GCM10023141 TaxID=3252653 RepID=UPI003620C60E